MRPFISSTLCAILFIALVLPARAQQSGTIEREPIKLNLPAKIKNPELGKRFVKLAMTYREAEDFASSNDFAQRALEIMLSYNNSYWEAAAYEIMAYNLNDQGKTMEAFTYLERAKRIYDKTIVQEDGSPYAIDKVMQKLEKKNSSAIDRDKELQEIREAIKELSQTIMLLEALVTAKKGN